MTVRARTRFILDSDLTSAPIGVSTELQITKVFLCSFKLVMMVSSKPTRTREVMPQEQHYTWLNSLLMGLLLTTSSTPREMCVYSGGEIFCIIIVDILQVGNEESTPTAKYKFHT